MHWQFNSSQALTGPKGEYYDISMLYLEFQCYLTALTVMTRS